MFRLKLFLFALGVAFIGLGILIHGLNTMYSEHRLNSKGKTATVVRIVRGGDVGTDEVHFRDDEDGEEFAQRMYVPQDVPARLAQHEKITVDYLPGDPWVNRWTGAKAGAGAITLFGLFMCASGAYMMRLFTRRAKA